MNGEPLPALVGSAAHALAREQLEAGAWPLRLSLTSHLGSPSVSTSFRPCLFFRCRLNSQRVPYTKLHTGHFRPPAEGTDTVSRASPSRASPSGRARLAPEREPQARC